VLLKLLYNNLFHRSYYNFFWELLDFLYFNKFLGIDIYERYYNNKANYVTCFSSILRRGINEIITYLNLRKLHISKRLNILKKSLLIDIGSGKGKILILSSILGFKRAIGIEKNTYLYKVSIKNLKKLNIKNVKVFNENAKYFFTKKIFNKKLIINTKTKENKRKKERDWAGIRNVIFFSYNPFSNKHIVKFIMQCKKNSIVISKKINFFFITVDENQLYNHKKLKLIFFKRYPDKIRFLRVYFIKS
jgi:16S rRNA G966 N2-methylase RsmD